MGLEHFSWMDSDFIERFSAGEEGTSYFYSATPFAVNLLVTTSEMDTGTTFLCFHTM